MIVVLSIMCMTTLLNSTNVSVGDRAAIVNLHFGKIRSVQAYGTILKITPKGTIVVQDNTTGVELRFKANGEKINKSRYETPAFLASEQEGKNYLLAKSAYLGVRNVTLAGIQKLTTEQQEKLVELLKLTE